MPLITADEIARAINIQKLPGLAQILMQITRLNSINRAFDEVHDLQGMDFVDKLLELLGIEIEIDPKDLKKIPSKGAFIAVANHPYGGIEGLILLKLLCSVRPETRLMVNFLLTKITNLEEYFIPVNPFEELKDRSSVAGILKILHLLSEGVPVAMFPAGEVASFHLREHRVIDRIWHPGVGRIIKKAQVPVLPVFFKGNNSLLFQVLGLIHPRLRTARLPSELMNKQGKIIKVRIGHPVSRTDLEHFPNAAAVLNYVRSRTYALEMGYDTAKKHFSPRHIFKIWKKQKPVIEPVPENELASEVAGISRFRICSEGEYEVYLAPSYTLPGILREIGRLREITFREEGEGSGKEIDLDQYDTYYQHLFLWHKNSQCVVGAYRVGNGSEIVKNRGIAGFYISELFKIKPPFIPVMESGLELGRSWIRKEFQNKPLPLFLLWRALLAYILDHPEIRYLFGPVSISNDYAGASKALMVEFIKKNYFDSRFAPYVSPRKKFKVKRQKIKDLTTLADFGNNVKTLDSIIADIDGRQSKIPVLIRQYIGLNGKIAAFNVDPKFSDCLDGLLILDISDVPASMTDKLKSGI